MKSRSAKAKGRRGQQLVREMILTHFPDLYPEDVLSTQMSGTGTDIKLSHAAKQKFPYSIEVKTQEKINIWASLKQAESNTSEDTNSILFFKRNNSKMYVTIEADHFFFLLKQKSTIDNPNVID